MMKLLQDLMRRLHQKVQEDGDGPGKHFHCLPTRKGCRQAEGGDIVRKLTDDLDRLMAQSHESGENDQNHNPTHAKSELRRTLSDDVHKQLRRVLEVIKKLTAEKGERIACHTALQVEEAVALLKQFIAADLPAQLITLGVRSSDGCDECLLCIDVARNAAAN
jgi:hypothetical protein